MILGNAFCAAILWLLVAGAVGRSGGALVWAIVFGLLASLPTAFALLASRGIVRAALDHSAVHVRAGLPPKGLRR
jgi:hypothetical protein